MGTVADKIAKKIVSSRGSKVVDLASWREGRKMAVEAGLGGEGPVPAKLPVLPLQRLEPLTLSARQTRSPTLVAFSLPHPLAQRLACASEFPKLLQGVGTALSIHCRKYPP